MSWGVQRDRITICIAFSPLLIWESTFAGNPEVVVQNMVGAGSIVAADYIDRVAAPDALTRASILPGLYFDQLVGRSEVQFDYAKSSWIGSTDRSNNLVVVRGSSRKTKRGNRTDQRRRVGNAGQRSYGAASGGRRTDEEAVRKIINNH